MSGKSLPLSRHELIEVTELQLRAMRRTLYEEADEVCWSEEVCGWVLDKANPDETGARGIRQIVQNDVEARLMDRSSTVT